MASVFTRDDLNRIVRIAAFRAQRNYQVIWSSIYDGLSKSSGKDVRALADQHGISCITVLENLGLINDAVKFVISKYGVRYE